MVKFILMGVLFMKKFIQLITIIIVSIFLVSCSSGESKLESINIIFPDGTPAVAISKFVNENKEMDGVKIEANIQKTTDALVAEVLKGEVDMAVVPSNLALQAYKKDLDYKVAATIGWGSLYLISTEEISDIKYIKGKEVYNTGKGLTPDIVCKEILNAKGINESDVNYTYVSAASELAPLIIGGKAKFAVVPEPILTTVMTKNPNIKIILELNKEWADINNVDKGYPQATLIVKEAFYNDNKKIANKVLQSIEDSVKWVNENPSKVGVICENIGVTIDKNIVEKALERANLRFYNIKDTEEEYKIYFKALEDSQQSSEGNIEYCYR
jgi:NitT/TauT family transport system substrate-binding protein